jgi:hypothetical protein
MAVSKNNRTELWTGMTAHYKKLQARKTPGLRRQTPITPRKGDGYITTPAMEYWHKNLINGKFFHRVNGVYVFQVPINMRFKLYWLVTKEWLDSNGWWNSYCTLQMLRGLYIFTLLGTAQITKWLFPDYPAQDILVAPNGIAEFTDDREFNFPVNLLQSIGENYLFDIIGTDYYLWNDAGTWVISTEQGIYVPFYTWTLNASDIYGTYANTDDDSTVTIRP